MIGSQIVLNITPWLHCGTDNEIQLVSWDAPCAWDVKEISLRFYDPAVYP